MPTLIVGLTGGVGAGKSLAAEAFLGLGVPLLDADQVAREVVAPGSPALREIVEAFGRGFLAPDGDLDRRRLREAVFADPAQRTRLEAITHPRIRERLAAWRDARTGDYAVLSVPILVRSGMHVLAHRVLVVDAPPDLQLRRVVRRDGISEALGRQMLAAQETREERLARADDVIVNEGAEATVRDSVRRLHAFYGDLARRGDFRAPGLRLP